MKLAVSFGGAILFICIFFMVKLMTTPEMKNDFLDTKIEELESYITYRDSIDENVSKVSIAWHIDHALITINQIYKVMDTSTIKNYRKRFNFGRTMMFTFNKIPRGRAQSPEIVKPAEIIINDSIYAHLEKAKQHIVLFDSLPQKAHFTHPYIGMLNRKQAKKFLYIHTEHHLKIIRDILKK